MWVIYDKDEMAKTEKKNDQDKCLSLPVTNYGSNIFQFSLVLIRNPCIKQPCQVDIYMYMYI